MLMAREFKDDGGRSLKVYSPAESVSRRSSMPFMPRLETVRGGRMSEASMWFGFPRSRE